MRRYLPGKESPYTAEFPEGTTVGEVLHTYEVPEGKPRIILVNGRHTQKSHVLIEGDLLSVFPPVAGG